MGEKGSFSRRGMYESGLSCSGLGGLHSVRVGECRRSDTSVRGARRMRALERDFEAVPELAALVADLLEEMDELRARLRREGLE